jgi:hypothetical protein
MQHQETIKGLICPGSNLYEETQLCNISLGQQIPCHRALLNEIVPGKQGKSKSSQIGSGKRGCMKFSAGQKRISINRKINTAHESAGVLLLSQVFFHHQGIDALLFFKHTLVRLHELYYMAYKSLLTQQPNLQ